MRDLVVVGASAGGVAALTSVMEQLPREFAGSVLMVLHMAPDGSHLVEILRRADSLPVKWAEHGEPIRPGQVYVAPADLHMLVGPEGLVLDAGPRENFSRPSINRTFRTAAVQYGSRTVGVLLTGLLQDGVDGLRAIRRAGGVTVAQQPADAYAPDLPRAAIEAGVVDYEVKLRDLGVLLGALVVAPAPAHAVPEDLVAEAAMDLGAPPDVRRMRAIGERSDLRCPDCGGPMWLGGDERFRTFRCYLGHAHAARDMLASESVEVERALWTAVRALHDRVATLEVLASDARRMGNDLAAASFEKRAKETRSEADLAREFLLSLQHARPHELP